MPSYEHIFHFVKRPRGYYYDYAKSKELEAKKDWFTASVKPFKDHPASYPKELIEPLILVSSKEGDLVYDPFMGSGTTATVSKEFGRNYIGSEINEL
jgi:site-specific DNA-methyltransferase (adenine-specific)